MKRILSGIQPSGNLHLGNYFAMIKPILDYQEKYESYVLIVNLHALTSSFNREKLQKNTLDAAADFLALGIDIKKSIFWVQSDVPEVMELMWYISCLTPLGLLERGHAYKSKKQSNIPSSLGLLSYPVLMAADILLFQTDRVPVGPDQKQHLEICRDIAIKFNSTYGEVFKIPEPEITMRETVPGLDGQKMSKSLNNYISIFSDEKTLKKQVMGIVTDSTPVDEPKDPDKCTLFKLYSLFLDEKGRQELRNRYINPPLKYSEVKKELLGIIIDYFRPYKQKRKEIEEDRELIKSALMEGKEKAQAVASRTISQVRDAIGILCP